MTNSIDLPNMLAPRYRDKTITAILKNLFNRHLSKPETKSIFGYVGNVSSVLRIKEPDLERQINQLIPFIYAQHANEELTYTWHDIIQKLSSLGVNHNKLGEWVRTKSHNLVPPIDLDKFCNYHEYYWIGNWVADDTEQQQIYIDLGIARTPAQLRAMFSAWQNESIAPEYYVIQRPHLDSVENEIAPQPDLVGWSDWSVSNLWIHKDDAISFLQNHPSGLRGFDDLVQATRPIIEYSARVKLNSRLDVNGQPASAGTLNVQRKTRKNQLPLFDIYRHDGSHSGMASAIFYYQESQDAAVDSELGRRVTRDENGDLSFEHSLVTQTGELLFYKQYDDINGDVSPTACTFETIWRGDVTASVGYKKYDSTGTIINQDKFANYHNYYWLGALPDTTKPTFNLAGDPEYNVIEAGGISDWSIFNRWVHVSQLDRAELSLYIQATRPIIEFNKTLESELVTFSKTEFQELPRFKLYIEVVANTPYVPVTYTPGVMANDAYTGGVIFARLADMPFKDTILTNSDVMLSCFNEGGEYYVQSLLGGEYNATKDGIAYGFKARTVSYAGVGNGQLTYQSTADVCYPEILTLRFNGTSFDVTGSVSGAHASPLTLDVSSTDQSGVTVFISSGATPFAIGDTFVVELKSYVYQSRNFYVRMGDTYRTLDIPSAILTEVQNTAVVDGDPVANDGVWEVPPQMMWNLKNETRAVINEGDLYTHLISIIDAQVGLVGNAAGNNNWRQLPMRDVGLGGLIKQYDKDFALLISLLVQDGVSIPALIDFARISYAAVGTAIKSFVETVIPQMLNAGEFTPPTVGDAIDQVVIDKFKQYFTEKNPVIAATTSIVDDHVVMPFYDTTSAIKNFVVTLPYLGLGSRVQPQKVFNDELNIMMMKHHDGHLSQLVTFPVDIAKKIVLMEFAREQGQRTPGIISGFKWPASPFRGQFWFNTSTSELYFYNVVTDSGDLSLTPAHGSYAFDRATNDVWQYNGTWDYMGNDESVTALPWMPVKLDLIMQNLELAIETELYQNCPVLTSRIDVSSLQSHVDFNTYLQREFQLFGTRYGITDVYATVFDSNNPFTWNYSGVIAPTAGGAHAAWQDIYLDVYGTARPDLYPWISSGYADEPTFITDAIGAGALPLGTTAFDPSTMWPSIAEFVRTRLGVMGRPAVLSVDPTTGSLISPFSTSPEALLTTPPTSATWPFSFGSGGQIERFWRLTADYLYSLQRVYFTIDPLNYVHQTWGHTSDKLTADRASVYEFDPMIGKKAAPVDFKHHGAALTELAQPSWINASVVDIPTFDYEYTFTCVSRTDGIFKLVVRDIDAGIDIGATEQNPMFLSLNAVDPSRDATVRGLSYSDKFITVMIFPTARGFFYGDTFTVTSRPDGTVTAVVTPQLKYQAEGFNQVYVQSDRLAGIETSLATNSTLYNTWDVKLGYRVGGMINTDTLTVNVQNTPIVSGSMKVLLKENKLHGSFWVHALRVQLVNRGSTSVDRGFVIPAVGPNGIPGEDWVFRVDTYNTKNSNLTWFEYDQNVFDTFTALNGERAAFTNWKRHTKPISVRTHATPFLVTGLQNLITFIFGYADALAAVGWKFNNDLDPMLDASTGRQTGYQLLVEQFITQQFSSVDAGSAFVFNPFYRKVWFTPSHGVVASLVNTQKLDDQTTAFALDEAMRVIPSTAMRVFREDEQTEFVFDKACYSLHVLVSEYEHVILFENYSADTLLIYDPFIGQRTKNVFINGVKQVGFTGRPDFSGHYLITNQMRKNLESSVYDVTKIYDTDCADVDARTLMKARSGLGFRSKDYFKLRNATPATEFRYWQGMIANKGTNLSVDAFLNSSSYGNAEMDEFWAYRVASYGDARVVAKTDLRVDTAECMNTDVTVYTFIEGDETVLGYDDTPPITAVEIARGDDQRWYEYDDLGSLTAFEAKPVFEAYVSTDVLGQMIVMDVPVDTVEIIDYGFTSDVDGFDITPYEYSVFDNDAALPRIADTVYHERGELLPDGSYTAPRFTRINANVVRVDSSVLLGKMIKVVGYGPAHQRYSPMKIVDHVNGVQVKEDLIWWDPARGVHHPRAIMSVDVIDQTNPAIYNVRLAGGTEHAKPWMEGMVGKVWWNTANTWWKPYYDTKFAGFNDRISTWGALSDASTIEVYEWVRSDVPPDQHESSESTGEVAVKHHVKRDRIWWQRPVAWLYSANPDVTARSFKMMNLATMTVTNAIGGDGLAILNHTASFPETVLVGDKIARATFTDTSRQTASNVIGTAIVTDDPRYVPGTISNYNQPVIARIANPSKTVTVTVDRLAMRTETVGFYEFEIYNIYSNDTYQNVSCEAWLTYRASPGGVLKDRQVLSFSTFENVFTYNFDRLGISIFSSDAINDGGFTQNHNVPAAGYEFDPGSMHNEGSPWLTGVFGVEQTLSYEGLSIPFTVTENDPVHTFTISRYVPVVAGPTIGTEQGLKVVISTSAGNVINVLGDNCDEGTSVGFYGEGSTVTLTVNKDYYASDTDPEQWEDYLPPGTYYLNIFPPRVMMTVTGWWAYWVDANGQDTEAKITATHTVDAITNPLKPYPEVSQTIDGAEGLIASFYVRHAVPVQTVIPFGTSGSQLISVSGTNGWISWRDPALNPGKEQKPPHNRYSPIVGSWSRVGNMLQYVGADITSRAQDPWIWFDGQDYTPYKHTWSDWTELKSTVLTARYNVGITQTVSEFFASFGLSGASAERVHVYVNENRVRSSNVAVLNGVLSVTGVTVDLGDLIRVVIDAYVPTAEELAFDPVVEDTDAFKIVQYKVEYPHVREVRRGSQDKLNQINYYYWVKNKTVTNDSRRLPIKPVAEKLTRYDDVYAIPQCLKYADQLDGRPNRYSTLAVRKLGLYARANDQYLLRVEDTPVLRHDDSNIALKNVHHEWTLLRRTQLSKIPQQLWDTLINTLVGGTVMGETLPNPSRALFDKRNSSTSRFGLEKGQVMTERMTAIATIKHSLRNPQISKYVNGVLVPDYISYEGFDLTQLGAYFATNNGIRKLMTDIWRNATTRQINEIFFAVLEDMAAADLTMCDLFKTSYISLSDIRTITPES